MCPWLVLPPISSHRLGMGCFPSQATEKGSLETKPGWALLQIYSGCLAYWFIDEQKEEEKGF